MRFKRKDGRDDEQPKGGGKKPRNGEVNFYGQKRMGVTATNPMACMGCARYAVVVEAR